MPERTFTTHDIADICDVYPSSIINWINSGKLKSYSTPGGHHRVLREDLLRFLGSMGMPLPKELSERPMRVLIVDDDPEVARMLTRAFARFGAKFETETCRNGVEALLSIGQAPPDLVVLDLILPKMDGLQVCRVLKAKPSTRDIRIIAISGKKPPFNEKRPSEAKIDAFFRKPLELPERLAAAAELLGVGLEANAPR